MDGLVTCPHCSGDKLVTVHVNRGSASKNSWDRIDCPLCDGTGAITSEVQARVDKARAIREARIAAGRSLRDEAKRLGISVVECSKLEQTYDTGKLIANLMKLEAPCS